MTEDDDGRDDEVVDGWEEREVGREDGIAMGLFSVCLAKNNFEKKIHNLSILNPLRNLMEPKNTLLIKL